MTEIKTVTVHPKPGVTIYLPGGTHGFKSGPVPMRADHAKDLAAHLLTEDEKRQADAAAAETPERAAEA